MKITTRYYKECVNKTIKKLTRNRQTLLETLVFNATAYMVEDSLFERGKLDVVYMNEKDFTPMSAKASVELIELLLEIEDITISSWSLGVAEFCTNLCEEIFNERNYL